MPGIGQLVRATKDFICRTALRIQLQRTRLFRHRLRRLSPGFSRHRPSPATRELGARFERNPVWKHVFTGGSEWLEDVIKSERSQPSGGPVPTLVGPDLEDISRGCLKNKKITLIVNDWDGDVQYIKDSLYDCLGSPSRKDPSKVSLKSGLTINVHDAITSSLAVAVKDLSEVAKVSKDGITTSIIHYGDHEIQHLDHGSIGGICDGDSVSYNELCALKTRFAGGEKIWRIFQSKSWDTKVVSVRDPDCRLTADIRGWSKALGRENDIWDPTQVIM